MITFILGTLGGLLGGDAIGTLIGAGVFGLASVAGAPHWPPVRYHVWRAGGRDDPALASRVVSPAAWSLGCLAIRCAAIECTDCAASTVT